MSPTAKLAHRDRLLVEAAELREDGYLDDASETRIALLRVSDGTRREIPWANVRSVSRREGPERMWWIPALLALVCGGLLGACGMLFDQLDRSTSGQVHTPLTLIAAAVGIATGVALGTLVVFASPGPWWEPLYAVPAGGEPAASQPVEERLAWGKVPIAARDDAAARAERPRFVAWGIIVLLFIAVWGFCSRVR